MLAKVACLLIASGTGGRRRAGGGQDCDGASREGPYWDTSPARRQPVPPQTAVGRSNSGHHGQSYLGPDRRPRRHSHILTVVPGGDGPVALEPVDPAVPGHAGAVHTPTAPAGQGPRCAFVSRRTGSCVRGPTPLRRRLQRTDATAAAFTDGWLRTGGLAELDTAWRLTVVGRLGDLIRTGGEAVAPNEVEQALSDHLAVEDVAVVGLPDPSRGELVCCVLVPCYPGAPPGLDELRRYLHGRLAPHKHPRRIHVVRTWPAPRPPDSCSCA